MMMNSSDIDPGRLGAMARATAALILPRFDQAEDLPGPICSTASGILGYSRRTYDDYTSRASSRAAAKNAAEIHCGSALFASSGRPASLLAPTIPGPVRRKAMDPPMIRRKRSINRSDLSPSLSRLSFVGRLSR